MAVSSSAFDRDAWAPFAPAGMRTMQVGRVGKLPGAWTHDPLVHLWLGNGHAPAWRASVRLRLSVLATAGASAGPRISVSTGLPWLRDADLPGRSISFCRCRASRAKQGEIHASPVQVGKQAERPLSPGGPTPRRPLGPGKPSENHLLDERQGRSALMPAFLRIRAAQLRLRP